MKTVFKILALVTPLLLFPCSSFAEKQFYATVKKVIDGDSLVVQADDRRYEIRLYGIDAPEYDQEYASEAKREAKQILLGEMVKVIPIEWDRYRRLVAIVEYDESTTINEVLLRDGLAWYYPKYCKKRVCGRWKQVARLAREKKLNLWGGSNPIAPWRWKQRKYRE